MFADAIERGIVAIDFDARTNNGDGLRNHGLNSAPVTTIYPASITITDNWTARQGHRVKLLRERIF